MTRQAIETALKDLNGLVLTGKLMDAFEKYYHPDVAMQENNLEPTISKDANRQRELDFLANVTDFRSAEVKGYAVGDNISFVVWHYDYTHKLWGEKNYMQVSVQQWQHGLIINEQFFYGN